MNFVHPKQKVASCSSHLLWGLSDRTPRKGKVNDLYFLFGGFNSMALHSGELRGAISKLFELANAGVMNHEQSETMKRLIQELERSIQSGDKKKAFKVINKIAKLFVISTEILAAEDCL